MIWNICQNENLILLFSDKHMLKKHSSCKKIICQEIQCFLKSLFTSEFFFSKTSFPFHGLYLHVLIAIQYRSFYFKYMIYTPNTEHPFVWSSKNAGPDLYFNKSGHQWKSCSGSHHPHSCPVSHPPPPASKIKIQNKKQPYLAIINLYYS